MVAESRLHKPVRNYAEERIGVDSSDWSKINEISRAMLGAPCCMVNKFGSFLLSPSEQSGVCEAVQSNMAGKRICRQCHSEQFKKKSVRVGKSAVFTCPLNFTQAIVPISSNIAVLLPGIPIGSIKTSRSPSANFSKINTRRLVEKIKASIWLEEDEYHRTSLLIETVLKGSFLKVVKKQISKSPEGFLKNASSHTFRLETANQNRLFHQPIYFPRKKRERRVVVSGLGIVSPFGIGKEPYLNALRHGQSGVGKITRFDASSLTSRVAGQVNGFDPKPFGMIGMNVPKGFSVQYAVAASKMAFQDAGISIDDIDVNRAGVSIGSSSSGMEFAETEHDRFRSNQRVSPLVTIAVFAGATSGEISVRLGIKGPSLTVSTGCAASTDAIGYATHWIRDDKCDIVIAGGTEALLTPFIMASFCELRVLSENFNDRPEKASRPFEALRDGMIVSEGAGILVIEELNHALSRNAPIYGEILGYAATGDAYHMTQPEMDGEGAARAMRLAINDAMIHADEIDYICAHGTSTEKNDITETKAIRNVFGKRADKIPVSSIKSMTGHTIGASGAVELSGVLLAMQEEFIPPTINYSKPDPRCDLDYVPNHARKQRVDTVLKNSFAFGGKNACLVVRRYTS